MPRLSSVSSKRVTPSWRSLAASAKWNVRSGMVASMRCVWRSAHVYWPALPAAVGHAPPK